MNSAQAYIALQNLIKLEDKKSNLKRVRDSYNKAFGIHNSSDHLYRLLVDNRREVMEELKKEGIATGIHYDDLHKHPVYATGQNLPQSEMVSQKTLSSPFHEELTDEEVEKIICKVKQFTI
jgi:dTDP-4-amino-4,6-dideoxygalactose transaminase